MTSPSRDAPDPQGRDGSPMNFPQPGTSATRGHPCPGTAEQTSILFSWKTPGAETLGSGSERTFQVWQESGPARLAGDGLLSVPVAGRDSSGSAWKRKMSVCVFIFSSALSRGCRGRCSCRRWGRRCSSGVSSVDFSLFSLFFPGFLGCGGGMRPWGFWGWLGTTLGS